MPTRVGPSGRRAVGAAFLVLLLFLCTLLVGNAFLPLAAFPNDFLRPVLTVFAGASSWFGSGEVPAESGLVADAAAVSALVAENARLREALAVAHERIANLEGVRRIAPEGYEAITSDVVGFSEVEASVIGMDSGSLRHSFLINAGSARGVMKGAPVLWRDAAVGTVTAVGKLTARVRLLTDPMTRVRARDVESRWSGVLRGLGSGLCLMKFVQLEADVQAGHLVVASGRDDCFPRGVLLGRVEEPPRDSGDRFLEVKVRPAFLITRISTVTVLIRAPAAPQ